MSVLLCVCLAQVVVVMTQSTLLGSQCDNDCFLQGNVEIQRLVAMMERNINERSEKRIMELESKLTGIIDKNNELESKLQNQTDTIKQLQNEISELKSKNQTNNVYGSRNYDCGDLRAQGYQYSGVYEVNVTSTETRPVYCEMMSDGTAWTRILHRQDNLTEFVFKKWVEYEAGFGDPQGSHWMGLMQMHQLTTRQEYKVRVDLMDWEGEKRFVEFSLFRVGPASDKYQLTIGGHSGTMGDSMTYHNNMMFTTIDQDNDLLSSDNCAGGIDWKTGGWWYDSCSTARLTGPYLEGGNVPQRHGIQWWGWRGERYSYKVATMKIQRLPVTQ